VFRALQLPLPVGSSARTDRAPSEPLSEDEDEPSLVEGAAVAADSVSASVGTVSDSSLSAVPAAAAAAPENEPRKKGKGMFHKMKKMVKKVVQPKDSKDKPATGAAPVSPGRLEPSGPSAVNLLQQTPLEPAPKVPAAHRAAMNTVLYRAWLLREAHVLWTDNSVQTAASPARSGAADSKLATPPASSGPSHTHVRFVRRQLGIILSAASGYVHALSFDVNANGGTAHSDRLAALARLQRTCTQLERTLKSVALSAGSSVTSLSSSAGSTSPTAGAGTTPVEWARSYERLESELLPLFGTILLAFCFIFPRSSPI